jgi:hypothetical protein
MRNAIVGLAFAVLCAAFVGCGGGNNGAVMGPVVLPTPFQVDKGAGNFYAFFGGPQRPSVNALRAGGQISASTASITMTAQMAGNIADGNTNYYVWGFNRGNATNAPFQGEPNVIFDAVVVVTVAPDGSATGAVNLIPPGAPVTLAASAIQISGAQITVTVPTATLPPTGAVAASGYAWNLWPRVAIGGSQAQVASFIPENAMLPLVPIP